MSDADASNVVHDLRLAVAGSLGACSSSRPAFPDRGDEPAEAGIGRRIARIAW